MKTSFLLISFGLFCCINANDTKQKIALQGNRNRLELLQNIAQPKPVPAFWNENCFDLYETKHCKVLKEDWRFCDFASQNRMDEMCRKTCGLCKQKADCALSKYKCCQDGVTPKANMMGTSCPTCKDKYEELCPKYPDDCNQIGWSGKWMRENCKMTCGLCKDKAPSCQDDENQKMFCASWKLYGMCSVQGSLMKKYCKKTCGFCDKKLSNSKI